MLKPFLFIAQVTLEPKELEAMKQAAKGQSKSFSPDISTTLGIILVVAAALFFWAFFIRKRPKQARGALVLERHDKHSKEAHGRSGRRRRRRRPDHPDAWGRNPTLEETGGLPPPRPDDPETPPPAEPSPHPPHPQQSPPAR